MTTMEFTEGAILMRLQVSNPRLPWAFREPAGREQAKRKRNGLPRVEQRGKRKTGKRGSRKGNDWGKRKKNGEASK